MNITKAAPRVSYSNGCPEHVELRLAKFDSQGSIFSLKIKENMDYFCYIDVADNKVIGIYPENSSDPDPCDLFNQLLDLNPKLSLSSITVTQEMAEEIWKQNYSEKNYNFPDSVKNSLLRYHTPGHLSG